MIGIVACLSPLNLASNIKMTLLIQKSAYDCHSSSLYPHLVQYLFPKRIHHIHMPNLDQQTANDDHSLLMALCVIALVYEYPYSFNAHRAV